MPDGVRLRVRLTPKSSRDALDAQERLADGSVVLTARVRAVPEDGKANAALEALIAAAAAVAILPLATLPPHGLGKRAPKPASQAASDEQQATAAKA
eukprot:gene32735-37828_t